MSRAERRQRREQERSEAKQRTRRGLCSRCSKGPSEHTGGSCPDGAGSFTWAVDQQGMESMVERLETLQGMVATKPELTRDEQAVLDAMVELVLGSPVDNVAFTAATLLLGPEQVRPTVSPQSLAQKTGLPLHHVRALLDSLVEKGMIERGPMGGAS